MLALIKNVIAPTMKEELVNDIKSPKYSLIIDKSTDISSDKQLCVVVRYFSLKLMQIVCTILGILKIESGYADAILEATSEFLSLNGLKIEDCIGLGTDGCNR